MTSYTYALTPSPATVVRSDGAFVPTNDPRNTDCYAYQQWLAAGNTPTPVPIPPKPTTIPTQQFLQRLTPAEETAVMAACTTAPAILLPLITALAAGQVTLTDPTIATWLASLVSANVITAAREAEILTP